MKVRLKLFAVARELAGRSEVELTLTEGETVGHLRRALAAQVPALAHVAQQAMFAVRADYADDATCIAADDEVACIPPVSGG